MFDGGANNPPADTSIPSKRLRNHTRYDPALLTKCLPDRSAGVSRDKGEGKDPNRVSNLNYWKIQRLMFKPTVPSELPPWPPRAFFGRSELVDQIIGFAENLTPLALVGPGGIGKTSIALTILHNHRIKQRFGDHRRFIRCDRFPPSLSQFLHRLSVATGAGVSNPKDLADLQPFLSSRKMTICMVLDNAESVLDPRGTDAREIYEVVEELSRFDNIWLCITSRISTIPPDCKILDIPTLSMEAARDTFYGIYQNGKPSDAIVNILKQLDFHPLSITLLATVAHQNRWDTSRLTREWEQRRTGVLQTDHKKSLAATIELSLASPLFQELNPDARALLEVVAFFPQGVNEHDLGWLFPTISNRENIFDKFCVLSLTHRSDSFVTMLAPLRDYLYPRDPTSSPHLCTIKDRFFRRLSGGTGTCQPDFEGMEWITSEDANIEHLLDVFASADADSNDIWDACANFMWHIRQHKPRLVILGLKIEGLPDGHPSKPQCMFEFSHLYYSVGDYVESKRLLIPALRLYRERENDRQVAQALMLLARVTRGLALYKEGILLVKEGIPLVKEASEIYGRLGSTVEQTDSLQYLAFLFAEDGQTDAAEEAVSRARILSLDGPSPSIICNHHHILGHIDLSRGEMKAAIGHFEKAVGIACSLNLHEKRTLILGCLVELLLKEGRLNDAHVHLESLKLDAANDLFSLGLATVIQACTLRRQGRFEEAESEVSRVIGVSQKVGIPAATREHWLGFLREVEEKMSNGSVTYD